MRDNRTLSHDVVSAATEMAEHVLTHLPKIEKQR
jgi:BarA-like signal transduction histidine kinase